MARSEQTGSSTRLALIGNLGVAPEVHDGQTVRTRLVRDQLTRRLGAASVDVVNTAHLQKRPVASLRQIVDAFRLADVVVVMPGERGLMVLTPLFCTLGRHWRRPIHYLVVGGWLPRYLRNRPLLRGMVATFDGLHVQSHRMVEELTALGFSRVFLLPNFRDFLSPLSAGSDENHSPLRLVFLSRLIPEKGVSLAVDAVRAINAGAESRRVDLDIYGPLRDADRSWFDGLSLREEEGLRYRGPVAAAEVIETLAAYDALLFPTWYSGEGFPGVVVEAYAAGIPVLASDWQDNAEVVANGRTGRVLKCRDGAALQRAVEELLEDPAELRRLKAGARAEAARYHVDQVIPGLLRDLGLDPTGANAA